MALTLRQWGKETAAAVRSFGKAEADEDRPTATEVLDLVETGHLRTLMGDFDESLQAIAKDGGVSALDHFGLAYDERIVEVTNQFAVDYARDRSAELVGMRYDADGQLIENPNPQWAITDATRELLRGTVREALEDGLSNDELADRIAEAYAFSDDRAETIARTETAFADVAGNLNAYKASGQVDRKQWVTAEDCCDECQELDGLVVDLGDDFPNEGGDGPPLHPNCRCDVLPVLSGEEPAYEPDED